MYPSKAAQNDLFNYIKMVRFRKNITIRLGAVITVKNWQSRAITHKDVNWLFQSCWFILDLTLLYNFAVYSLSLSLMILKIKTKNCEICLNHQFRGSNTITGFVCLLKHFFLIQINAKLRSVLGPSFYMIFFQTVDFNLISN